MIKHLPGPFEINVSIKKDESGLEFKLLEKDGTLVMSFDLSSYEGRQLATTLLYRVNILDALNDNSELSKRAMRIYKEATQYTRMTTDQEYLSNQQIRKMMIEQPNLTDHDYRLMISAWILGYWRG